MAYWNAYTPTNRVILAGGPLEEIGEDLTVIGTVTYAKAGVLVAYNTSDDDVIVCAYNGKPIGVLGWERSNTLTRPSTITTAYAAGDRAFVHEAPGIVVRGWLGAKTTSAITKGDKLYTDDNGMVCNDTSGTSFVGIALESIASTGAGSTARVKFLYMGAGE